MDCHPRFLTSTQLPSRSRNLNDCCGHYRSWAASWRLCWAPGAWPEQHLPPRGPSCLLKILLPQEEGVRLQVWSQWLCWRRAGFEPRAVSASYLVHVPRACGSTVCSRAALFQGPCNGFNTKWRETLPHPFAVNLLAAWYPQGSGSLPDGHGGGALWEQASFYAFTRQPWRLRNVEEAYFRRLES